MIKSVGVKFYGLTDFIDLFMREFVTSGFSHRISNSSAKPQA